MKQKPLVVLLAVVIFAGCISHKETVKAVIAPKPEIPSFMKGDFTDDYGIDYTITDSVLLQYPRMRYKFIRHNKEEQYIIARNDEANPVEGGRYTRIDYMSFENMDPWKWGYCLTVYNAANDSLAEHTAKADRQHPKKGCNGFPFSRMKKK